MMFSVGDRVRLVDKSGDSSHPAPVGALGIVAEASPAADPNDGQYLVVDLDGYPEYTSGFSRRFESAGPPIFVTSSPAFPTLERGAIVIVVADGSTARMRHYLPVGTFAAVEEDTGEAVQVIGRSGNGVPISQFLSRDAFKVVQA